jgi:ATP-dependent Clp protease ATP-binding subunit ClpA
VFEKFTGPARRVIFFARFEASQYGSPSIETEHLLLGLTREDKLLLRRFLPDTKAIDAIREQIDEQVEIRPKISTSVDIPLSDECVRIFGYTAEEGETIGTGQLLLGILREENCIAAKILKGLGVHIVAVRGEVLRASATEAEVRNLRPLHSDETIPKTPLPLAGVVPDAETAKLIAEAVWTPRTSGGPLDNHVVALNATLTAGVWTVTGSHSNGDARTSLAAFIQKEDGKILRLHQETLDS